MTQKVVTPPIKACARCGAQARVIGWNFDFMYRVMCDNNHTSTKECGSAHRAICLWNNRQDKIAANRDKGDGE